MSDGTQHRSPFASVVEWLAAHPFVAVAVVALGALDATVAFGDLPRDVFPNLTTPTFNVIVQSASMGTDCRPAGTPPERLIHVPMSTVTF